MFTIQLVNHSTRSDVTSEYLASVAAAVTEQCRDFAADYGLAVWTVTTEITPGSFTIAVADQSTEPGAEGYHDDPNDTPEGFAFALGTLDDLSVTISHECLELIRDQDASGFRLALDGTAYADEACDAVEDQTYRASNGMLLSDYVLPDWYVDGSKGPWDKLRALTGPHTKTAGGYTIQLKNGTVATDPPNARLAPKKADPRSRTSKRCT